MVPTGKVKRPNSQLGLTTRSVQVTGGAEGENPNKSHLPPEVPGPGCTVQGWRCF